MHLLHGLRGGGWWWGILEMPGDARGCCLAAAMKMKPGPLFRTRFTIRQSSPGSRGKRTSNSNAPFVEIFFLEKVEKKLNPSAFS